MNNVKKTGLLAAAAVAGMLTVSACSNTSTNHDMSSMSGSQTSAAAASSPSGGQTGQTHNDAEVRGRSVHPWNGQVPQRVHLRHYSAVLFSAERHTSPP